MAEPSNLVKVVAAFVAGVVVALGGALILVRAGDLIHPLTVAQTHPAASASLATPVQPPSEPPPSTEDSKPPQTTESKEAEPSSPPVNQGAVARKATLKKPTPPVKRPKSSTPSVLASVRPPDLAPGVPGSTNSVLNSTVTNAPLSTAPYGAVPVAETSSPAPLGQPHVVTLQSGTTLAIRLAEPLSTDHNYPGDTFRGVLNASVIIDGFIIAEKGSRVLGRVIEAQRAGRVQGSSVLSVALTEINTTDGQRIRVATNSVIAKGPTGVNGDAIKIASGAAIGAIIGAITGGGKGAAIGAGAGGAAGTGIVLATRGHATTMPTESQLSFQLSEPVTIRERIN